MQAPQTQYVERDGISIAYQVVGDGPVDMLIAPGFISHLDLQWTDPGFSRFLSRLASFTRLIMYDKPGTGLSDPIPHLPTLEERGADITAVLDAAGSERAVLFGQSEGGPCSVLLAATRPERIASLVLYGTFRTLLITDAAAYSPEMVAHREERLAEAREMVEHWGDGARVSKLFAPSLSEFQQRFLGTFARAAASPRMARALIDTALQIDVRDVLSSVHVPTLVLHVEDDRAFPLEAGQLLADGIPGARFVTFPGIDHAFWLGDFDATVEAIVDEIERFVTGAVQRAEPNRVLASVLFTDIVASTTRAAELGDRAWREVLERHDALVDRVVSEHGGRVVKHIGDGALSAFGGPAMAMRCAEALRDGVAELGIELRGGIHTGECEAIGEDLGGLAVHIGARVGALAEPGEIVVSSTVKELVVGSDMQFSDRGEHELKGVPGSWHLYALGEERMPRVELDGAAGYMRRSDRVAVTLARRMPRAMRLAGQLASRGTSPT
ncbi:MAG TPA: adenylate/guanylate cyclase domain-containing protein [Solirubrobacterales bacterium]|nr:adenylate/guanylate cyclase domain-containing protein [Solirubrobacterales bacterium]